MPALSKMTCNHEPGCTKFADGAKEDVGAGARYRGSRKGFRTPKKIEESLETIPCRAFQNRSEPS